MTMPIHTFQDILDALEQNPRLAEQLQRHLLSQRLLELPEVVARLTERVDQLAAAVAELTARLEEFVRVTNERLGKIETDIADLKAGQDELRAGQDELRAGQNELRANQVAMRADLNKISGTVSRLDGTDYEHQAAKALPRVARRLFNLLQHTQTLHHDAGRIMINLPELEIAVQTRRITPDELEDLQNADIIVAGRPHPGQPQFVLAEASITVEVEDVQRAHRRSAILSTATRQATMATVIGTGITDEAQKQANRLDVRYVETDAAGQITSPVEPYSASA